MKILFVLTVFTLLTLPVLGQKDYIISLENEVYELNNNLDYVRSQQLLHNFIQHKASSNEDKYYGYLFLSYTFKRLYDYDKNLEYLDKALSFGLKTSKRQFFEANIRCQKAFAFFDIAKYEESDKLMQTIVQDDFKHLDEEHKAKILMQQGYLLYLSKHYQDADVTYDTAIEILKDASPCDLPMIFVKKIELYAATDDQVAMNTAYRNAMFYSDSCGIIKYSIYAKEMLINVITRSKGHKNINNELDSLKNISNVNNNLKELNRLDTEHQMSIKDLEIANQKMKNFYFLIICILLVIGIVLISYSYYLLIKQKKLLLTQYQNNEQLISMLSHDIKEPLLGVQLMLHKLEKEGGPYAQISKSLENQISAVKTILNNLLALRTAGNNLVKLNTCNVGKVLKDVIQVLTNEISQKRLHIDYSAVSELNLPIQEEKLRIVIYNLLTNAIKYSHHDGCIEVYQKDKSLFIRDYGKGIPSELIGQLMKKIMNSKTGTLHEKGTGLGMFLVGRILTDESIRVRYHETRNAGTLVSVGI